MPSHWHLSCLICGEDAPAAAAQDLVRMQEHIARDHFGDQPWNFWKQRTIRRVPSFQDDPLSQSSFFVWYDGGDPLMRAVRVDTK